VENKDNFQYEFFETTGVGDFKVSYTGKAPFGYPKKKKEDIFSWEARPGEYEKRKDALIKHAAKTPSDDSLKGFYYELARLKENKGVHENLLMGVLNYIESRRDCSDFLLLGIMRIVCQFRDTRKLSKNFFTRAEEVILGFKYWPDEPGIDSLCTWTENHQIMFSVNEYLAGDLLREKIFGNGNYTGLERMERARGRILQWLELRFRSGFSEWLSHIYYDEDITALVNLVDFAPDPILVQKGKIVLDLIFLDMACNSFHGIFGSSHGRSYKEEKCNPSIESTIDTAKLLFGMGRYAGHDNMSAVTLALSENYRLPKVIEMIADDTEGIMENRQQMSFFLKDAKRFGLDTKNPHDAMTLLSMEAYTHPLTVMAVMKLFERFNWWENQFFEPFAPFRTLLRAGRKLHLLPLLARVIRKDITRNVRDAVNVMTYRTPDYMLSAAQDHRPGYGGDQQHIWQATLSPEAVVFTTHPGHFENTSGGYWVGSGTLPRVAQHKNVLIACYNVSRMPGLYMTNRLFFTHAWFPREEFDEVKEEKGWIFGRKGEGFIGLYSRNGHRWQTEGEDSGKEVIAEGRKNTWICEMGNQNESGSFEEFTDAVASAPIHFRRQRITYESPSRGKISFGWRGNFTVAGKAISLRDYPRYENPWCRAEYDPKEIHVVRDESFLKLNFKRGIREYDSTF